MVVLLKPLCVQRRHLLGDKTWDWEVHLEMITSLCSLHAPSGFDGRLGPEVGMGLVFPGSVLAATALVGGRAGPEGTRVRARCKPSFLPGSVAVEDY